MGKSLKIEILENIGKIYEQSKGCKLNNAFLDQWDDELNQLSAYFRTSKSQSFFIAMVFAMNYKGDTVDLNDLIEHFECSPVKILEFSDDIDILYTRGIFRKYKVKPKLKLPGISDQFYINEKVTEAILRNLPIPKTESDGFTDVVQLLGKLYDLGKQRVDDEISTAELFVHANSLISSNLHFPLIKRVQDFQFNLSDTFMYFYLIWKTISGKEKIDIGAVTECMYENPSQQINYMQGILSGENPLIKDNLAEIAEADFFNDTELKLSDHSYKILHECDLKLFVNNRKRENVIHPSGIAAKELVFGRNEKVQLDQLKNLLYEPNLVAIKVRLKNQRLPGGITVLLHGAPGTGKTESVMQLARETDREIMKVDISQTKSMWFGQSQKIVKRIFTEYQSFASESERTPILLFNEADAILSRRRNIDSSNVAQTENTIQNILLEEMENLDGILIATTNLVQNLDPAFDRRFLFKVRLEKPGLPAKARIWKLKLPGLSTSDCETLASEFDFSGGQIDNIVRKSVIHGILQGSSPGYQTICNFCREEMLEHNGMKIGFNKS